MSEFGLPAQGEKRTVLARQAAREHRTEARQWVDPAVASKASPDEKYSPDTLHKFTSASIDLNGFPDLQIQWDFDGRARLYFGRFASSRGRIATHAGLGVHDLQLDENRQIDCDRAMFV